MFIDESLSACLWIDLAGFELLEFPLTLSNVAPVCSVYTPTLIVNGLWFSSWSVISLCLGIITEFLFKDFFFLTAFTIRSTSLLSGIPFSASCCSSFLILHSSSSFELYFLKFLAGLFLFSVFTFLSAILGVKTSCKPSAWGSSACSSRLICWANCSSCIDISIVWPSLVRDSTSRPAMNFSLASLN